MCDTSAWATGGDMKREALIRELRKWARKKGVYFEVIDDKGRAPTVELS
jgi:geranylgeranyl pyrophosphate synthase